MSGSSRVDVGHKYPHSFRSVCRVICFGGHFRNCFTFCNISLPTPGRPGTRDRTGDPVCKKAFPRRPLIRIHSVRLCQILMAYPSVPPALTRNAPRTGLLSLPSLSSMVNWRFGSPLSSPGSVLLQVIAINRTIILSPPCSGSIRLRNSSPQSGNQNMNRGRSGPAIMAHQEI